MYLDFFGLREQPFNITPDPRYLYFSERHREAYQHLLYGIEQRKGFIQLTGEVGSGKTTLCRAVVASLKGKVETGLILNPWLSETQLLRAMLHDFGLEIRGRDRLAFIEALNRFLLDKYRQGINVALLIDEAQDLSPAVMEQVRLLSNLETDQHKLVQIVLVGQPELRERLERPDLRQLKQRITVRYHLSPLDEAETAAYIRHRLGLAGGDESVTFEPAAVRLVHRYSRGIPRIINAVCDNALLAGYVMQTRAIRAACCEKAIKQLEGNA